MNMKKLFPEEKGRKKRIMELLDKKGFYIVLLLCIAIVGGTAVYVMTRNAASDLNDYDAQNIIPEDIGDDSVADAGASLNAQEPIGSAAVIPDQKLASNGTAKVTTPQDKEVKPTATPKPSTGTSSIQTTKSSGTAAKTTSGSGTADNWNFSMPVFGEVTFEFAKDKLLYSKTLEEWRTHDGLDIAADRGTPVKAVADGVVSEIKNDPRFGVVIVIDHKDGVKTVYSNLASDDMVTPNQKVMQGDIIGSVGNTAAFESAEQSHLHFEVLVDNVSVDPVAYLPQEQEEKK
ncbi:MAG: M23 family peptidase [Ruminiclostridium sp.]|nr:M23 family peptidase [Ruminiclostridium sp.]